MELAALENGPTHRDGGHRQQLHWRSFEPWSSYGARLAPRLKVVSVLNLDDVSLLPQTRQYGKAVGIVELGGLEKSICVLGPWCPYKIGGQRGLVLAVLHNSLLLVLMLNILVASTS
jgi:hypothetical protein